MLHFRRMQTLQKFVAVHGAIYNQFTHERHFISRRPSQAQPLSCHGRVAAADGLTLGASVTIGHDADSLAFV